MQQLRKVSAAACSLLMAGVLTATGVTMASAEETSTLETSEDVAAHVVAVAPDGANPVPASQDEGVVTASVDGIGALIPLNDSQNIQVTSTVGSRDLAASISLPSGIDVQDGELTSSGTVVYAEETQGERPEGAVAVQTLENGDTRIQTVIADRDSSHRFGYAMEGFLPIVDDLGNAGFLSTDSEGLYIPVDAAWAVDASGQAVPTHYEVDGNELVQVVIPSTTTSYPIVADPTWGWRNFSFGATLSRYETSQIKNYAAAIGMCQAIVKRLPTIACGAWGGYLLTQAAIANSERSCVHVIAAPVPGGIIRVPC